MCASLSALFTDNGGVYDLHSLISRKLILGLPTGRNQWETEAEEPVDDTQAVQHPGREQVGEEWRVDCPTVPPAQGVSHASHWALI